ncbi:MAG: ABC transporter permease [Dehalococcoidales bacterium]
MSEVADGVAGQAVERKRRHPVADFFIRLVREKPLGTFGGIIVLLMLLTGIFADLAWIGLPDVGLAPYGYDENNLPDRLQGSSATHWLGTDALGRDLFSRIIHGARISMIVGLGASAINVVFSSIIGVISGYLGGKVDIVVQRFVDAALSFPMLIIVITLMAIIGTGLLQTVLVLGIWGGIGWIRVPRSAVMAIRENVYVDAARAIGSSVPGMLWRHILPNIVPILIVMFSVSMSGNILGEASLSFLGFGIPPPFPSWGGMLSGEGRRYMYEAWWLAIWPGVALSVAVYGINMWGDAVRDLLDPRLRGGIGRYSRATKKTLKTAGKQDQVESSLDKDE